MNIPPKALLKVTPSPLSSPPDEMPIAAVQNTPDAPQTTLLKKPIPDPPKRNKVSQLRSQLGLSLEKCFLGQGDGSSSPFQPEPLQANPAKKPPAPPPRKSSRPQHAQLLQQQLLASIGKKEGNGKGGETDKPERSQQAPP